MKFLSLWILGALLNFAIVSIPLLWNPGGATLVSDPRFQILLVILTLWIGCDLSAGEKEIDHYQKVKIRWGKISGWLNPFPFVILLGIWVCLFDFVQHPYSPSRAYWMGIGSGLSFLGLLIRYLAIRSLGSFFSAEIIVLTFQPLITSGLFQWIRHPSYAGLLLIVLGVPVVLGSLWGLLFWLAITVPLVIFIVGVEENILAVGYGNQFENYRRQTKRLIPFFF